MELRQLYEITLEGARPLVRRVVEAAAEHGQPISVAVVDSAGVLIALERMTAAPRFSADLATTKARTAVEFGRATSELEALFMDRPAFAAGFLRQGGWYIGRGGVPIIVSGVVVGGIGVSGHTAENEEEFAQTAAASFAAVVGPAAQQNDAASPR